MLTLASGSLVKEAPKSHFCPVFLSKKGVHERVTDKAELKADRSRERNLGHCGLHMEADRPCF